MRDINLLALMVCIGGGLYVYKNYPREKPKPAIAQQAATQSPQQDAQSESFAPPPVLYKCETASGETVYKDKPCPQTARVAIIRSVQPQPQPLVDVHQREINAATAANKRAEEALARQWDARMAQRDRDIASERISVQQQTAANNSECSRLREQRSNIQRMAIPAQQDQYWQNEMSRIRARMNQLYC